MIFHKSKEQKWFNCYEHHIDLNSVAYTNDIDAASTGGDDDIFLLLNYGFAPCGAVEPRVPFSKHINVARAVFRPQNRWKRYLYTWVMGFSVF